MGAHQVDLKLAVLGRLDADIKEKETISIIITNARSARNGIAYQWNPLLMRSCLI
jgi:hypothetical protein